MKKKLLLVSILVFSFSTGFSQDVVFSENFESLSIPSGWTQEYVIGEVPWIIQSGGHQGNPPEAYQGTYNAFFQYQSYDGQTTKFITPPIDLLNISKPELRFAHAQDIWYASGNDWWDKLKIYYKRGEDSSWVLIQEYLDPVTDWTNRSILLPDSSLSSTYYIAFEGINGYGHGVCIDTMRIIETGVIPKYLESIEFTQPTTSFMATGTQHNPVLRIDLNVIGNDGSLFLDSIAVKSLNTSDEDISTNGVKLFATTSSTFTDGNMLASGNFTGGLVVFDNLNYDIPRDVSYLWVTYDIKTDINHEIHGDIADAKIDAYSININDQLYPYVNKSPLGYRYIYESILYDDFETDKGWRYTGEFERNIPEGLIGERGKPDPSTALSGSYIIGTDLTNDGMYPNNLTDTAYIAEAPTLDCEYYKDIYLTFYRWLNIDFQDNARILTSTDNLSWNTLWKSQPSFYTEDLWSHQQFNLSSYFTRKETARLKFSLGPTNDINRYTGWNIDDVVIIGNYISKDVGITNWISPLDGCGHTSEEYVSVTIKNFAGEPLNEPLILSFSFNGGTTIYYDTIPSANIPVGGTINYTLDKPVNLTTPGWYNNVYATTNLAGDEDATNNRFNKTIFIAPTYTLPYSTTFETNYAYYRTGGTNSSWAYGTPAGAIINTAASGTKAWVTSLTGTYNIAEDSYLESPCFNFSGIDYPVFEFKSKGLSQNEMDGMAVYYTINDGDTWNSIPETPDYIWNWYNEGEIESLDDPGIDSTNNTWLTFRKLLPLTTRNQSSVKFRFVFKSDSTEQYEGFGIDDVKIYDAPADLGVTAINYPVTQCELSDTTHLKISVKNFGLDTLKTGTKIPVGYKFKGGTTKRDTITLASNLIPNATVHFTFNSTVDMSYEGDYAFEVFTLAESNPYLYSATCNDTLVDTISVIGMPRYNPFPDLIGANPIDTFLVAGTGYSGYVWDDGGYGIPDVTPPQDTLYVDTESWYKVTVTNAFGCNATDSVEVVNSEIDLAMEHIYTELVDSCERNALTEISVRFQNNSFNDLEINDTVALAYQINNLPIVRDTLFVTSTIAVGSTGDFTFAQKADFMNTGNYTLKVFIDFLKDLNHDDDTATVNFNTWGYVAVELTYDTIYSSQADTLELVATPGYTDYLWSTTEITGTISPSTNVSQWYKVTVSDDNICGTDKDSTYIETYDFGIQSIINPVSDCEFTTTESIVLVARNYSGNTYAAGTKIPFKFNFDNTGWVNDSVVLTSNFTPLTDKTLTLPTKINPSALGEHTLSLVINAQQDANVSNNSNEFTFETWGYPDVELAYDTIFTTRADTVVLLPTLGYNTYLWNDASTNDTLIVTNNYSENYVVTVTDAHGCGSDSDSTQIITYNLGVSSVISPKNACSHTSSETVRIYVKNYSNDVLESGETINVGYIFNGGTPVNEVLTLTSDLSPSQTVSYYFNQKVNMSAVSTYTLNVFTDFDLDVYRENDSIYDGIKTYGYPTVEIGPDIYTDEPETLLLIANPGYNNYSWNEGTKNDTLHVTKPETFNYVVTVTDINGCSSTDNLTVYTTDIGATALISPVSQCELTNDETVIVEIQNTCADTIASGESITVSYKIGTGSLVSENMVLSDDFLPNETVQYPFTASANLSAYQNYSIKTFAKYSIDVNTNDTLTTLVEFRRPDINLGPDVNATEGDYTIDAGAGYSSYLWFDGTTTRTYTVNVNNQTANYYYAVTVTNSYGCEAEDSVRVLFNMTPDLELSELLSPESDCLGDTTYAVELEITNTGDINLASGTSLSIGYRIDNGSTVTENKVLSTALNAGATVNHIFAGRISLQTAKTYDLKTFLSYPNDVTHDNDTLVTELTISSPDFSFTNDTITVSSYPYVLDAGSWESYLWQNNSTGRQFTVTTDGWYKCTVTDEFDCQAKDSVYVKIGTGIDGQINGESFVLNYYPNPVYENLNILIDAYKPVDLVIELLNTQGQIIYNKRIKDAGQTSEKLYTGNFAKGLYYIRFTIENKVFVRKIVIQ